MKNKLKYIVFILLVVLTTPVYAQDGTVNVNDSLTFRSSPSVNGSVITSLANATVLNVIDTNAGSDSACSKWYKVSYNGTTGYVCGEFVILKTSDVENEDDSYNNDNYKTGKSTIMCYEDTGALNLRKTAGGVATGKQVNCGDEVEILETAEGSGTCGYYYKVSDGTNLGYVCGYFVNTTKLSTKAQNYYNNKTNGDTISSYQEKLKNAGFPTSYYSYLLELHARHPNWNFTAEKINKNFDDVVKNESGDGQSWLQSNLKNDGTGFSTSYLSLNSTTYNVLSDTFKNGKECSGGYCWYNASEEAIAYYMDPRNYLNEKYIFAFENLSYDSSQTEGVVKSIIAAQSFFGTLYSKSYGDNSVGSASGDIVKASKEIGISASHVATRIYQEMGTSLNTSDSRLGGSFTYGGKSYSGYYNFFNIKSGCTNCSSIYAGYALEKGWNTPYKGIYGGASFMYNGYISLNQDTIYYEKFDVSRSSGAYTHQYMQNLSAPVSEGGTKFRNYVNNSSSYLNQSISFVIPVYNNMPESSVTAPKVGNPNNYLKDLKVNNTTVSGFSYNVYNYNIYLESNVTSVNISASQINSNAKVSGAGTIQITSNNQTNKIVVTSESGKTREYTIVFNRKTSEKASVVDALNNSGYKYNTGNNTLFGITPGTNSSTIINNIVSYNNSVSVSVKDSNGSSINNSVFKTGDTVTITDSENNTSSYNVVIYGDPNGDGTINAQDYMRIKNYIMGKSSLSDSQKNAADANHDGVVNAQDYMRIKNYIMGKSSIEQ